MIGSSPYDAGTGTGILANTNMPRTPTQQGATPSAPPAPTIPAPGEATTGMPGSAGPNPG